MAIFVQRYHEGLNDQWDDFVAVSLNGTLMQERKFLNYHPPNRFLDHSLIFMEHHRMIAVLPAAQISDTNAQSQRLQLISHPGASHGELIISSELRTNKTLELVKTLLTYSCA